MQLLGYIGNIGGAVYILNNLKRVQILGLVHWFMKLQVHEMWLLHPTKLYILFGEYHASWWLCDVGPPLGMIFFVVYKGP